MDEILLVLDETPQIQISHHMSSSMQEALDIIIEDKIEAQKSREEQLQTKAAKDRRLHAALEILFENPAGIGRADLLHVAEIENIGPLIVQIQAHLKNTTYLLRKRSKNKSVIYFLSRKEKDNNSSPEL